MNELFANYELNRKSRWPRLLRTATLSVVVHAAFVLIFWHGATIAAFWQLASLVTGSEYADQEYTLGQVKERAVIIKASDVLLDVPPDYVTSKEDVVVEPTPEPTPEATPLPTPTPETEEERLAREQREREALEKAANSNGVRLPGQLNSRPFKDLLAKWNKEYEAGRLNLNNTIDVTVEADRKDDGTLENMELTGGSASDPAMVEVAKDLVAVLGATGALDFLEGARHLKLHLILDGQRLSVVASTELDSAERASSMAKVYSVGLTFRSWQKKGTDEGQVWEKTSVSANGKTISVRFEMPRDQAGGLLAKQVQQTGQP